MLGFTRSGEFRKNSQHIGYPLLALDGGVIEEGNVKMSGGVKGLRTSTWSFGRTSCDKILRDDKRFGGESAS